MCVWSGLVGVTLGGWAASYRQRFKETHYFFLGTKIRCECPETLWMTCMCMLSASAFIKRILTPNMSTVKTAKTSKNVFQLASVQQQEAECYCCIWLVRGIYSQTEKKPLKKNVLSVFPDVKYSYKSLYLYVCACFIATAGHNIVFVIKFCYFLLFLVLTLWKDLLMNGINLNYCTATSS